MHKYLLHSLFISLLFAPLAVIAQAPAKSHCTNEQASLLWQVKGKNSHVYLFGSIHLGRADFYPLPAPVEQAFRQADHLVFEVDPSMISNPANAQKMQQKGMLPPDKSLDQVISPALLEELSSTLNKLGMPVDPMLRFRPWFVASVLTNLQILSLGYSPDYGVEYYLLREMPDSADIMELESFDSQLAFLQRLDGEAFLKYTLAELREGNERIEDMITAWGCGDKQRLQNLLTEQLDASDKNLTGLKQTLLLDRNKPMADKIVDYLRNGSGSYFVVVGAAHYLGEGSIIDLLQQQGYQVDAVY